MRYLTAVFALTLTAILAIASQPEQAADESQPAEKTDAGQETEKKTETDQEPPLLLDDDPPLLLDDDPPLLLDNDGPSVTGANVADNSRCHVCHLNFEVEDIAVVHAKENIGCPKCHGECDEHIADESWAVGGNGTAPDKLYYRKDIDACCEECHQEHDVPAQKVIALWQKRHPEKPETSEPEKIVPGDIVCTDCHGDHKLHLKDRKCKWK